MIGTRSHKYGYPNSIRDNGHRNGDRKAKNWHIQETVYARSARKKTDGRERKTHGGPPPCTEQPIGARNHSRGSREHRTGSRNKGIHGGPPPCTEQPIGARVQFLVSHRDSLGGVFTGYMWNIRGVFMGYTYVSGMCRVCIGYVSGMHRNIRRAEEEGKMYFFREKFGSVREF